MQLNSPAKRKKILMIRLSSLGDVVLSTAVLSVGTITGPQDSVVDWVVADEFAPLLRGHPAIGQLWGFDRKAGFAGWRSLCDQLIAQGYDEVLDLHGSLRTRFARVYFLMRQSRSLSTHRRTLWRRLKKGRLRLYGLYIFKHHWPVAWRPLSFTSRFTRFAGGTGQEKPDLMHLVSNASQSQTNATSELIRPYFCVMPSSKWAGKCWPATRFLEVLRDLRDSLPVILGGKSDAQSVELTRLLEAEGIPHVSGVGRWDLRQVASVLAGSTAYLGNDTGLAHLAESLGVPSLVIYGPTSPEMGFAPWRPESRSVGQGLDRLGCRPCGKDGRRCYRFTDKYLCMSGLTAAEVSQSFVQMGRAAQNMRPNDDLQTSADQVQSP